MSLAYAILASLAARPGSGYDLSRRFDGSVGFFWRATAQQIYRELDGLQARGWISTETVQQQNRPAKKICEITDSGREQLARWIAQPAEPLAIKDELMVKVFAGHLVSRSVVLQELERHRQLHHDRLETYREIEQQYFREPEGLSGPPLFEYLTLVRGMDYEKGWVHWCDEAIRILAAQVEACSQEPLP